MLHRSIALVLLVSLFACDALETRDAHFSTYEALPGAGEPGNWVPSFLPRSTTDIRVRYKIDTGAALLSFHLGDRHELQLSGHCETADARAVPLPPRGFLGIDWWPDALARDVGSTGLGDYEVFRCERNSFLAIRSDPAGHAGFYWRLRAVP
jgi:hypothetical protein